MKRLPAKTTLERCVDCNGPVQYVGDTYCYECGRRSELDAMRVTIEPVSGRKK
jgi:hypothetical protein